MQELLEQVERLIVLQANATEGPWAYETDENGYDGTNIFVDEHGDGEKPNPSTPVAERLMQGQAEGAGDAEFICWARECDFAGIREALTSLAAPASDATLRELQRLFSSATPAPWGPSDDPKKWVTNNASTKEEWRANHANDAALVVALRNEGPGLLARLLPTKSELEVVQCLVVECSAGEFVCAVEDWLTSGLSLLLFLQDQGVLGDDDEDLREIGNIQLDMRTRKHLANMPEWNG